MKTNLVQAITTFLNIPSRLKGMFCNLRAVKALKEINYFVKQSFYANTRLTKHLWISKYYSKAIMFTVAQILGFLTLPVAFIHIESAVSMFVIAFILSSTISYDAYKNPDKYYIDPNNNYDWDSV
jgi:hypothetical protein